MGDGLEFHSIFDQCRDFPTASPRDGVKSFDVLPLCQSLWIVKGVSMPEITILQPLLTQLGCSINAIAEFPETRGDFLVFLHPDFFWAAVDVVLAAGDCRAHFGGDQWPVPVAHLSLSN